MAYPYGAWPRSTLPPSRAWDASRSARRARRPDRSGTDRLTQRDAERRGGLPDLSVTLRVSARAALIPFPQIDCAFSQPKPHTESTESTEKRRQFSVDSVDSV